MSDKKPGAGLHTPDGKTVVTKPPEYSQKQASKSVPEASEKTRAGKKGARS